MYKEEKIQELQDRVEDNSRLINSVVTDIITPYCKELDDYVLFIKDILHDGENPPTNSELDDFCMNLSTYIYFASGMCEQLGIKDDIAKAIYKEIYNSNRDGLERGTIADKNAQAELLSQNEQIVSICYARSYKIVKAKVESAQELLSSCKKVLSRRISEQDLTTLSGGK